MADLRRQLGVTLIEMVIVLGVIVLLAGGVIVLTRRVENQSKEKALANTFAILETALQQFYDYGYQYPAGSGYDDLRFPPDCSGFRYTNLTIALSFVTGVPTQLSLSHMETMESNPANQALYLQYSGCEMMYYLLSQVPECRQTLARIDGSFVTNKNMHGDDITIRVATGPQQPLLRVVDPWGTTLRYDYYMEHLANGNLAAPSDFMKTLRNFPVLVSAGPDKKFDTPDDISSGRGKR